jgi:hypothetical protein
VGTEVAPATSEAFDDDPGTKWMTAPSARLIVSSALICLGLPAGGPFAMVGVAESERTATAVIATSSVISPSILACGRGGYPLTCSSLNRWTFLFINPPAHEIESEFR